MFFVRYCVNVLLVALFFHHLLFAQQLRREICEEIEREIVRPSSLAGIRRSEHNSTQCVFEFQNKDKVDVLLEVEVFKSSKWSREDLGSRLSVDAFNRNSETLESGVDRLEKLTFWSDAYFSRSENSTSHLLILRKNKILFTLLSEDSTTLFNIERLLIEKKNSWIALSN